MPLNLDTAINTVLHSDRAVISLLDPFGPNSTCIKVLYARLKSPTKIDAGVSDLHHKHFRTLGAEAIRSEREIISITIGSLSHLESQA